MDYDRTDMPENYERGRNPPPGVMDMWMARIAAALDGRRIATIVDLGCGTGRFTTRLAALFDARVIGVDPSEKMLSVARAKPAARGVSFARATAEDIPCADGSVDLVFMSMAFHHFTSREKAVGECRRILRAGGLACVRNSTREQGSPYERFFPNYRAVLDQWPSAAEIGAAFKGGGFMQLRHDVVAHMMARTLSELADKAAFRADSTLLLLSDDDFERGLGAMRAAAQTHDEPAMIGIDLFVFAKR
jgi:ubiquinone/menaquinone biosynthesis C-methylase UbiE